MDKTKTNKNVNKPEHTIRSGAITATIWKNTGTKDKKEYTYYSVNLERSYKDKEDEWQKTGSLRSQDLPKAILVLQKAYEYLNLKREEEEITED